LLPKSFKFTNITNRHRYMTMVYAIYQAKVICLAIHEFVIFNDHPMYVIDFYAIELKVSGYKNNLSIEKINIGVKLFTMCRIGNIDFLLTHFASRKTSNLKMQFRYAKKLYRNFCFPLSTNK